MAGNALVVATANGDTARILKTAASELVGGNFVDFVHCEDKAVVSAAVQRLRRDDQTVKNEYRYVSPAREIIWLEVSMVRNRQGTLDLTLQTNNEPISDDFLFG